MKSDNDTLLFDTFYDLKKILDEYLYVRTLPISMTRLLLVDVVCAMILCIQIFTI